MSRPDTGVFKRNTVGHGGTSRGTYLGVHLFHGESPDVLDGLGRSLLELDTLKALVEVNRVVTAGWLHLRLFSHLN